MKARTQQVTIHQAKTHLSRLLVRVGEGVEIIIAKGDLPIAKLVAYSPMPVKREFGKERGQVEIHEDFNELPLEFKKIFGSKKR